MIDDLSRRFAVDGFELAWDRWGTGDGPPLVLGHGFSGSSHDFALQIEPVAAGRTVAAIDHRGHGLSSKTKRAEDYTVERIAADVIAWIEDIHQNVFRNGFALIGHKIFENHQTFEAIPLMNEFIFLIHTESPQAIYR